ncbi:MAG TPA: sensor histidine kinase [Chloroflexota bacterium]|nr:sensor histidine kinase [Chloroflexota bacterium]
MTEAAAPAGPSPADYLFRALSVAGGVALVALALNIAADPDAPGVAGQGLALRAVAGFLAAPSLLGVGALIVWRAPGNAVGRCLVLIGLNLIAAQVGWRFLGADAVPAAHALGLMVASGVVPAAMIWLILTFPTGRVHPPRLARAAAVLVALRLVGPALHVMSTPGDYYALRLGVNPFAVPALVPLAPMLGVTLGPFSVTAGAALALAFTSAALRYRAAGAAERQQIKWVLWAFTVFACTTLVFVAAMLSGAMARSRPVLALVMVTQCAGFVAVSGAIGIGILRHRLFNIDRLINRTLVYGALSGAVVALYVLVVGYLGIVFRAQGGFVIELVATGVVASLFQPLRERLQRAVNRLLYGEPEDPYRVISHLGQQLEETLADLCASRERLVTAREEERRRIRRDLHDGLGPSLAGLTLRLDAARNLIAHDPHAAAAQIDEIKAQVRASLADIRRVVYDLRPPALDQFGLVPALREHALRYAGPGGDRAGGLRVTFEAPESFPTLPAAVEVAAYRIAREGMTNVVRHARARTCHVRLDVNGALELEVADDGVGFAPDARAGVGLASIRERAAELGGTWLVEPGARGGTRVLVRLPLPAAEGVSA